MELTAKLLTELQRRLKIGNRRGVHLNAIPGNSRYKFDLSKLSFIDKNLPSNFINALLTQLPLRFRISWKDNVPDLNSLFEEDQVQLVKITKAFENLINQTDAIESEKGINTFGFGFPILVRRDNVDNKLTVAPILIWSLRIKRTKEFNTWEINRNEEDPIYLNEVLINHLLSDAGVEVEPIPSEMLDDGLISKDELLEICMSLINTINSTTPSDLRESFAKKLNGIAPIGDKNYYEKLPLNSTNSFIDFGGLFSIFEVQKQNIISDYGNLLELQGLKIDLDNLEEHSFQPLSSVETDPSQQNILHSLEASRNILIQGPPGTGKSQTLTAILVNALENNKRTIVVCEKRTALEVLHNALVEKGLNYHCVLIRDIVKDRRNVVDSVRDRIDSSEYRKYRYKYSKDSLDNSISRAKELITSINKKHQKLAQQLLGNKVWSDVVGDLLSESKGYANDAHIILDTSSLSYTTQELNHLLDVTQKAQGLYREYQPLEKYSFINPNKFVGENPYSVEEIIHRDFDYYSNKLLELKGLLKSTRVEYVTHRKHELSHQLAEVGKQIDGILEKENKLEILLNNWRSAHQHLRVTEFDRQILSVESIIKDIEAVYEKQQGSPDFTNDSKINSAGYKVLSWFSSSKKEILADHVKVNGLFTKLEQQINACKDIPNIRFQGDLAARNGQLTTFKNELSNSRSSFEARMGEEFDSFNFDSAFDSDTVLSSIKAVEAKIRSLSPDETKYKALLESIRSEFHTYFDEKKGLFKALTQCLAACSDINSDLVFDCSFGSKRELLANLNNELRNAEQNFDAKVHGEFEQIEILSSSDSKNIERLRLLQETAKELCDRVINDRWSHKEINSSNFSLFLLDCDEILQRKQEYFGARADLFMVEFKWFQFYNNLTKAEQALIRNLKPTADWRKSFILPYLHSLLVKNANLDLPTSDNDHVQLSTALQGIEKEQLKYIKEYWYSQQIDATRTFEQLNGSLTVANLYNKKSGTRHKRLALRQIVQYDANLFTTFFPIILTSPDVCSNLFKGMNDYFDIVMFDEASQLRLEDNLPAILKGKQVVIAGDEHQMPPSNYFSKVFDGSIEDEEDYEEEEVVKVDKDDILLSCESLLDFGTELNFHKRHLDFHYRSRHPYLIDFSNHAFYSQRLKPLPNNFEYVPIKYIQVGGTFSDHTNDAEAEMVLSILENNINRLPNGEYPTVGIATFNISQRNLIKSKILERQKFSKFEAFNSKIQELEEKGMFVKNLENIQGDERDVIILSTTYGIGKDGKFAQRFGPINQSKGFKLLNVIITRAKYKVYVCSSIPEQVFMNYKDYLVTEGNNKRAVFYAYLAYAKGVSDKNDEARLSVLTALSENTTKSVSLDEFKGGDLESPFEEEVYQILSDHFGADKLIPQMQFAGFRIDIVYNSGIAGTPKIAIECDGAKYHTSKEAYLYDRHRQKILEKHGFVFHRIWSTNWWRNTPRETDSLVEFIKKIEATKQSEFTDYSKTALAFTDDVAILERYVAQLSLDVSEDEEETIKSLDQQEEAQPATTKDQVKPTSLVHIKYVNNGKFMKVQIVETEKFNNEPSAEVQKIFVKSPLAESMIGHTTGSIVKVGNLDNFVEILEIEN